MSVLAEAAPPIRSSPRFRSRRMITVGVVAVLLAVTGVTWFTDRTSQAGSVITFYPSASYMAKRLGCRSTFHTSARPGGSSSAGACTTRDGVRVEFRTYTTEAEASAWLDGARGEPTSQDAHSAGAVGGNWAILITGARDLNAIKAVMRPLS